MKPCCDDGFLRSRCVHVRGYIGAQGVPSGNSIEGRSRQAWLHTYDSGLASACHIATLSSAQTGLNLASAKWGAALLEPNFDAAVGGDFVEACVRQIGYREEQSAKNDIISA